MLHMPAASSQGQAVAPAALRSGCACFTVDAAGPQRRCACAAQKPPALVPAGATAASMRTHPRRVCPSRRIQEQRAYAGQSATLLRACARGAHASSSAAFVATPAAASLSAARSARAVRHVALRRCRCPQARDVRVDRARVRRRASSAERNATCCPSDSARPRGRAQRWLAHACLTVRRAVVAACRLTFSAAARAGSTGNSAGTPCAAVNAKGRVTVCFAPSARAAGPEPVRLRPPTLAPKSDLCCVRLVLATTLCAGAALCLRWRWRWRCAVRRQRGHGAGSSSSARARRARGLRTR